jgi:hypothetical protein
MSPSLAGSVELTFEDGPDAVWTRAILAALGIRPRRWRTPCGQHAPWTAEVAAAYDLELCGWDIDTNYSLRDGCEETVRFARLMAAEAAAP